MIPPKSHFNLTYSIVIDNNIANVIAKTTFPSVCPLEMMTKSRKLNHLFNAINPIPFHWDLLGMTKAESLPSVF
jgi:hypothetical protein